MYGNDIQFEPGVAEADSAGGGTATLSSLPLRAVAAFEEEEGAGEDLPDEGAEVAGDAGFEVADLNKPYPAPNAARAAWPLEAMSSALSNVDLKTAGLRPIKGESYMTRPRIGREAEESVERSVSAMTRPPMLRAIRCEGEDGRSKRAENSRMAQQHYPHRPCASQLPEACRLFCHERREPGDMVVNCEKGASQREEVNYFA